MAATLVPTVRTTYTLEQMIEGFIRAWYRQFKVIPKKESVGVIWAQSAIETGTTTAMWNNNIGNIKFYASSNPDNDNGIEYMMLKNVWEIINGQKVIFQPPHKETWFRSFKTLEEGIAFHLNFLKNKRYKSCWSAVEAGSPAQFASLLKKLGYYSAPEADYVKAMSWHFDKFMKDPTFEKVLNSIEPNVFIALDGEVSITGDLSLVEGHSRAIETTMDLFDDTFKQEDNN